MLGPPARGVDAKIVTANTGRFRLDHTLDRASRDRRIHRVAAGLEDVDGRLGGERVRRAGHGAGCMDRGASRKLKISHNWVPWTA